MLQTWKVPHILKGMLTYVPVLNAWRMYHGATGGSSSQRYCYAVWLRHLVVLDRYGFKVKDTAVGELGPGDSIGAGLAALLSGARQYVGLDVVPYSAKANLTHMLIELAQMYESREPIPGHVEFPRIRPRLVSYDFPDRLVDSARLSEKVAHLMDGLKEGPGTSLDVSYRAPWTSVRNVEAESLDSLIFSQAVLQYVDRLEETYRAMFAWLKPGGLCSHSTGLGANNFSPFWNGHWAYTDLEWRMVRGRREVLLNRQPLSTHLQLAGRAGFETLHVDVQYDRGGLTADALDPSFRQLADNDRFASGAMMILRKPLVGGH